MSDELTTQPCITRHPENPVLSATDVPYHATLVFNAGVTKWQGRYVMMFRNDYGDPKTKQLHGRNLGLAWSDDGVHWACEPQPLNEGEGHPLAGFYDPRLTVLEGRAYLCFATGLRGTRGGVAVSDDLRSWQVLHVSVPDNRNMVLFPDRFHGKLVRLERPFAGYLRPGDRFDMWLSMSPDGRYWGESRLVQTCEDYPWCNNKIGPGAPPVRTDKGWLALTHVVDIDDARTWGWSGDWGKRYSIGLVLLDLERPWQVIGLCREPLMAPSESHAYETRGYRGHVLFPGGMILEDDGEVKVYYGAADTVEALATCRVDDLLALCEPV